MERSESTIQTLRQGPDAYSYLNEKRLEPDVTALGLLQHRDRGQDRHILN